MFIFSHAQIDQIKLFFFFLFSFHTFVKYCTTLSSPLCSIILKHLMLALAMVPIPTSICKSSMGTLHGVPKWFIIIIKYVGLWNEMSVQVAMSSYYKVLWLAEVSSDFFDNDRPHSTWHLWSAFMYASQLISDLL